MPNSQPTRQKPALILFFTLVLIATTHAAENSKYVLSHSLITSASPETIWFLWEDVENWKQFDTLLEYSRLEPGHAFISGAKGVVKAAGAPKTKFELFDVIDGKGFTERLYVPLYQTIDLKRRIEKIDGNQTRFTHEVHFTGRLRFFIHLASARRFKKELPLVMKKLKVIAEAMDNQSVRNNTPHFESVGITKGG